MGVDKFIQPIDGIEVTPAGGPQILLDQETLAKGLARIAAGEDRDQVILELAIMEVDLENELRSEGLMPPEDDLPVTTAAAKHPLHDAADKLAAAFSLAIHAAFVAGKKALRKDKPDADAAAEAVKKSLTKTLPGLLARGATVGGELTWNTLPGLKAAELRAAKKSGFDRQAAVDWADKHAAELIDGITEATREDINNAIADALESGNVEDAYDEILAAVGDPERADLIVQTEIMTAVNEGQREAWRQAVDEGLIESDVQRVWQTQEDEMVCPICSDLDGETADIDGSYADEFDGPPAHPRCRCLENIVSFSKGGN